MRIYVEGGGDTNALRTACRRGFAEFLKKAGFSGKMPSIVACGGRRNAYESFCTAIENGDVAMLLVDSETPVAGELLDEKNHEHSSPWQHLNQRIGDEWTKPSGSEDWQCHLMVPCMEAWLIADRQTLGQFFGQGFKETALPSATRTLEHIDKTALYKALADATRNCKTKTPYGKGEHSFLLLALINPHLVSGQSPWAARFISTLKTRMGVL